MSSQGASRKRPAPGTSPLVHQQMQPVPNFPPSDSQLSNDQFLQWGQNVPPNINTVDPNAGHYQPVAHPAGMQNMQSMQPSNQLTRRGGNTQLVSRPSMMGGMEHTSTAMRASEPIEGLGETEEELYQRALAAKKEAQAKRKQIPPFVQKLSSFLDESKNTDLIRWSDDGNSFIVLDEEEFAKTLIPELFKHNNYASFVRQLNMYGFHKKVGLSDNSMRASERKNKSPSEYSNPYFRRGHPELLWLIQKPKNSAGHSKGSKGSVRVKTEQEEDGDHEDGGEGGADEKSKFKGQLTLSADSALAKEHLANVYRELQNIRHQQQIISNTINKLRREHEQLYRQAASFQEQHTRHENSINAILTFLATVYNRSLQGHEGAQGLVNSFAGAIPQDSSQGNIVDMSDYMGNMSGDHPSPGQRAFKKQPLLLKAPPALGPDGQPLRTSLYDSPHGRRKSSASQSGGFQTGNVEELFDHNNTPQTHNSQTARQQPEGQSEPRFQQPQRDIMSMIQSSNARNGITTTHTDFPAVLSSLENSGGNTPLTANQRADMLRLIANENQVTDPATTSSTNNALITPNPPPMPNNFPSRLASTRAEIDNLVRMQAEQDRSVQNLTNLLQPLSPTGTIPGVDLSGPSVPPSLDLDNIFNSGDYFSDYHVDDKSGVTQPAAPAPADNVAAEKDNTIAGVPNSNDLFDFDNLPDGSVGDMFGDSNTTNHQQRPGTDYFDGFDPTISASPFDPSKFGNTPIGGYDGANDACGGHGQTEQGRVIESFSSSEATSPTSTSVDGSTAATDNASVMARPSAPNKTTKRRRKNQ
ncbi:hypothetical protein VTO42DRAFT_3737 [Malbranchea cinnamomea]